MITFADRKGGFPHSEMSGSKGARASPDLIAACHVLHRLSTPRHPSEALMRLIVLSKTHAWLDARAASRGSGTSAIHALCISQTMMSSQVRPASAVKPQGEVWSAGLTLPSRCHLAHQAKRPAGNFSSRSRDVRLRQGSVVTAMKACRDVAQSAKAGGARRDRTDDLKLAKLPLSQLSYGPRLRTDVLRRGEPIVATIPFP